MQPGQVEGDNPEEIKKQKAIKGFLNKITPEKFDKIVADIIAVGYETEETESGLIDQVPPRHFNLALPIGSWPSGSGTAGVLSAMFSLIYLLLMPSLCPRLPFLFLPLAIGVVSRQLHSCGLCSSPVTSGMLPAMPRSFPYPALVYLDLQGRC